MELSIAIPQEIIEEIIVHLAGDLPTLKCCATASHSLFLATRKHIFSTVCLYQPSDMRKLHSLLGRNPEIAALISILHVYIYPQDILLSTVLPSLSRLRNLIIGREGYVFLNWRTLHQTVKTMIEDLIKSPTLHTLQFTYIVDLPISIVPLAAHVKVLKLTSVQFTEPDARHQVWDHPNLMQVELIHLFGSQITWIVPPLLAPHLRHCTIRGNSSNSHLAVQKVFAATKPEVSIQDLTWLEYRGNDLYTNPAFLSHPRRLTFVTWTFDKCWFRGISSMWSSMAELLKSVSLRNLEELSVTMRSDYDRSLTSSTSGDDTYWGATGTWWDGLDALPGDFS